MTRAKVYLGLFCHGSHDSAVAIVNSSGEVLFASEQERYDRIKHSSHFPKELLQDALCELKLNWDDVAGIGFAWDPFADWRRTLGFLARNSFHSARFLCAPKQNTNSRLRKWTNMLKITTQLKELGWRGRSVNRFHHHLCHVASSFYCSGFESALCLTVDGNGEIASTTIHEASIEGIRLVYRKDYPDSLGHFYASLTQYLGFRPMNDEYKVMGLAAYGKRSIAPELRAKFAKLINGDQNEPYRLNTDYFQFQLGKDQMWSPKLEKLLGPARDPQSPILPIHQQIAALTQEALELALLNLTHTARILAPQHNNLCLAGGVALNCVANEKIFRSANWRDVFIPPCPHDSGTALGAAYLALAKEEPALKPTKLKGANLGSGLKTRDWAPPAEAGWRQEKLEAARLAQKVAALLESGKIVAWATGKSEFGPRALGNRSILADPRNPENKERLNLVIKRREAFRPFAPVVLAEHADLVFDMGGSDSPFMLRTVPVRSEWIKQIPAAVHVDGSARVQTLEMKVNPKLYAVLSEFHKITGVPVLLNTSLNTAEEPICNNIEEVLSVFRRTSIDVLVVDDWIIER